MWETKFFVVLVAYSFHPTAFGDPKAIMASLQKTFRNAYPIDYPQFGVLYLHKGDPNVDNMPTYDVHRVCDYKQYNVIEEATTLWSQGTGPRKFIIGWEIPIWPTLKPLIDKVCNRFHPNIATAGFNKKETKITTNAGHSEYYLLTYALADMLSSYRQKEQKNNCPDAAFLYTVYSPCDTCHKDIINAQEKEFKKQCPNMPFYVGYTDVYRKDTWGEIEIWLVMNGIQVIHVPKP